MRRTIAAVGRALVTIGLLILLFVGYQLWGTGIFTARAQDNLRDDFAQQQQAFEQAMQSTTTTKPPTTTTSPGSTTTTTADSPVIALPPDYEPQLEEGSAIGQITIPKIDVKQVIVEGTNRNDLKKGPGHYPSTPLPGQVGNAAIAGHRTTYGAPFYRLDRVAKGDKIVVETVFGKYTYEVFDVLIVGPRDVSVVDNTPDAQITLTTCNPKFSASQRLVVKGKLVPNESSKATPKAAFKPEPQSEAEFTKGLRGDTASRSPAVAWGIITSIVGLAWWWCFRRYRHPATWVAGAVPFLIVLFVFYVYLERMLPAGY